MPKKKEYKSAHQSHMIEKWEKVNALTEAAGFDADALAHTEFCLMPFYNAVIEMCADEVEKFANSTAEHQHAAGALAAAQSLRNLAK